MHTTGNLSRKWHGLLVTMNKGEGNKLEPTLLLLFLHSDGHKACQNPDVKAMFFFCSP